MIKVNDWYFMDVVGYKSTDMGILGTLVKIIKIDPLNPNYVVTEEWDVTENKKIFISKGIFEDRDAILYTKFGKKVKAPPKTFELLYSESVNQNMDSVNNINTQNEYNED